MLYKIYILCNMYVIVIIINIDVKNDIKIYILVTIHFFYSDIPFLTYIDGNKVHTIIIDQIIVPYIYNLYYYSINLENLYTNF